MCQQDYWLEIRNRPRPDPPAVGASNQDVRSEAIFEAVNGVCVTKKATENLQNWLGGNVATGREHLGISASGHSKGGIDDVNCPLPSVHHRIP
jgi:hypothetical protein